jgi:hypothetical protein
MAKVNEVHSVIIPVGSANFSAHSYTEIYGGSAGCTAMINDVPGISIGPSSSVFVWVRTISGGTGCFLCGVNQDVIQGSTLLP